MSTPAATAATVSALPGSPDYPQLYFNGTPMKMDPEHLGPLRSSSDALGDADELQARMSADGYLFLPGLLDRPDVLEAQQAILRGLSETGSLHPDYPVSVGRINPDKPLSFIPGLVRNCQELRKVLYSGPMMDFFADYFGEPVMHYDYTWFRAKSNHPGNATRPHYDIVYMGRGERHRAHTVWTPIGDVPPEMGGLIVLEGSHKHETLRATYGEHDVDATCQSGKKPEWNFGSFRDTIFEAQAELGGRWLTADYKAGDVLIFSFFLLHASSDNQTDTVRLSSDSRYQIARGTTDDRWFGPEPIGHGAKAHRELIC